MTVDSLTKDRLSTYNMTVDSLTVDRLSIYKMTVDSLSLQHDYRQYYSRPVDS